MIWTVILIEFIVQLLCCMHVERRLLKYLPTAIPGALLVAGLLTGGLSLASLLWLALFGGVVLGGLLAIGIYLLAK